MLPGTQLAHTPPRLSLLTPPHSSSRAAIVAMDPATTKLFDTIVETHYTVDNLQEVLYDLEDRIVQLEQLKFPDDMKNEHDDFTCTMTASEKWQKEFIRQLKALELLPHERIVQLKLEPLDKEEHLSAH